MLHQRFLPTLFTDTDTSIFGMIIVLAFQICIFLVGFIVSAVKNMKIGMNFP